MYILQRIFLGSLLICLSSMTQADVAPEPLGLTETLPKPYASTWFWATDPLLRRVTLTDFNNDRALGTIDGGQMLTIPLFSKKNNREFYVPETHYSRGSRGVHTDIVTFYNVETLSPITEVIIPPKRAQNSMPIGNATLSDDEEFIAVFNMMPAQSISIVDVKKRRFVEEIETPGCSLVYGAGKHRFMMLCGDGSLMFVSLNTNGTLKDKKLSAKVFDPQADPITEKAARFGNVWHFVSFEGFVYAIDSTVEDVSTLSMQSIAPWSLFNNEEREEKWRIGGRQFIAIHEASQQLYVLMHQGEVDTHKDGGTDLWVYNLASKQKTASIGLQSPGFSFSGVPTEFGTDWIWPFNNLYNVLTRLSFAEPHARPDSIVVTQETQPTLLLTGQFTGMVAVYNALTLEFRHRVTTGNISNLGLFLPQWHKTAGEPTP
jgi:methylamine dehydrogenase heavy chain